MTDNNPQHPSHGSIGDDADDTTQTGSTDGLDNLFDLLDSTDDTLGDSDLLDGEDWLADSQELDFTSLPEDALDDTDRDEAVAEVTAEGSRLSPVAGDSPEADDPTQTYIAQLEEKVTALQHLLKVTTHLNMALLNADTQLNTILSDLMDAAAKITRAEDASVLLWNNNRRRLFFAATTRESSARSLIGEPVPLDSIAGTVFNEQCAIQVDDVSRDPRHYPRVDELLGFRTRSLLGVPMISRGKVIGVLEVVNKRELPWTFMDRSNLELLAEEAAVAIEVAQLVVALRRANRDLREVDKLKSNFIAIASHELRTPLGVIMGYASFLMDEQDTDINNHATKVMQSAMQLRGIIEGMVNLRYLKQKSSELSRKPIALNTLMEDMQRDILSLSADASQYAVTFSQPDDAAEILLNLDRSRIAMAFINIFNNAFAFTPAGGSIRVEAVLHEADVWISFTDTGCGIAKKHLKKVFDEFFQVEDHMTRKHGGLGIGLSITKALVKAHGGRVWATSPGEGQGATFTISLPVMQSSYSTRRKVNTDILKPEVVDLLRKRDDADDEA